MLLYRFTGCLRKKRRVSGRPKAVIEIYYCYWAYAILLYSSTRSPARGLLFGGLLQLTGPPETVKSIHF
jgi:hypothetical protein